MAPRTKAIYPPLDQETRERVDNNTAAFHLLRKPKTLRGWADGTGPIQPKRIRGRLSWAVSDIRRLLSGGGA
jgi:hypothetical protein